MQKILFVFRKTNKGNFSIEKVFGAIYEGIVAKNDTKFSFSKLKLNHNYDVLVFIYSFVTSLFSKKKIIQITGACYYMVLAFPFQKRVITIHDLFHFNTMKGLKGYLYNTFYFKLPIFFSHQVIAISKKTKKEILSNFRIKESKITIIHNPLVIPTNEIEYRQRYFSNNEKVNILQIGDKPLKNYVRLIEATKNLDVFYSFVHANPKAINDLIIRYGIKERASVYSNLTDQQLYNLFKENDVLFFASEEEGFGLPIIEAQSFGLQVITSSIEPMSAIGNGAILVDPFCIESIKKGFLKLYNKDIVTQSYAKSEENIKRFDINFVIEEYLNFYKSMA